MSRMAALDPAKINSLPSCSLPVKVALPETTALQEAHGGINKAQEGGGASFGSRTTGAEHLLHARACTNT